MQKPQKRSKSIFLLFFFSYIMVLTIPLIVAGVIYFKAEKVLQAQTSNANMAILSQMRQTIDSHINEVKKLSNQISTNQNIRNLTYSTKQVTPEDRIKILEVVQNFTSYKYITPFIDDFYVYLKNMDYVITSSGSASSEFFYQTYNPGASGYIDWKENIVTKTHNGQYYFTQSVLTAQEPTETLVFLHSFQFFSGDNPVGNIGVMIQTRKFEELLSGVKGITGGAAYIIDSKNHIMASNTPAGMSIANLPKYTDMTEENGIFNTSVDKEKFVISYISSEENDWKYVTVFPQYIIQDKINYVRSFVLTSLIISTGISILLILYLSYRNYHPINKIVTYLDSNADEKKGNKQNDFRYIENTVVKIMDRNKEYIEKFEQYTPVIRSNLILKLIKGQIADNESWDKMLSFSNINFLYDRFAVILFSIENCYEYGEPDYGLGMVRAVIIKVTEENVLGYSGCLVHSVELENGTVAMLLNIRSDQDQELKGRILDFVEETKKYIEEKYHTVMTAGIGCICERFENIKFSYQEAVKALDYKILKGISTVISYEEIGQDVIHYQYSTETETQLTNYVKTGDQLRVEKLLKEIFDTNFKEQMPLQEIRCLYFDCMDVFGGNFNPVEKLLECKSVQEMYELLLFIYKELCNYINRNKKSHNDVLLNQILAYIEQHFSDENLSQVQIADHLEISPTYLSNFFKEQFGEKMTNYIAKVKVDRAKLLLADDSLTISRIAQMTGCSTSMNMIRIFKKIEGITPGQYRDSLKQKG